MKRIFFILSIILVTILFSSCSHDAPTGSDSDTVRVIVSFDGYVGSTVSFTLYDEESEIYKQFTIRYDKDYFKINHFKKGQYKMIYKLNDSHANKEVIQYITINTPTEIKFSMEKTSSTSSELVCNLVPLK